MIRSLYSASSGMQAQQTKIDVIANNLANVSTPGFKGSTVQFEELLYDTIKEPGTGLGNGGTTPGSVSIGYGTKEVATPMDMTDGEMMAANGGGYNLNLAIHGQGFFKVELADGSGTNAYTRNGSLTTNPNGEIVTNDGLKLVGAPTIPPGTTSVKIATDGTVSLISASGTTTAGKIGLTNFINPQGLKPLGGGLLGESPASGTPQEGVAGLAGFGSINQGYLENSNVSVVTQMVQMIQAQRAYEVNSKAIQAADQMMQQADNIKQG